MPLAFVGLVCARRNLSRICAGYHVSNCKPLERELLPMKNAAFESQTLTVFSAWRGEITEGVLRPNSHMLQWCTKLQCGYRISWLARCLPAGIRKQKDGPWRSVVYFCVMKSYAFID